MNFNENDWVKEFNEHQRLIQRHTYYLSDGQHYICATEEQARAFAATGGMVYNGLEERVWFGTKYYRATIEMRNPKGKLYKGIYYEKQAPHENIYTKIGSLYDGIYGYKITNLELAEVSEEEYYKETD